MSVDLEAAPAGRRWLARVVTTLAAWFVAFLLVLAMFTVFGRQLKSLPSAVEALVFTGVLVPFMGNVVMPWLGGAVARAVMARPQARLPRPAAAGPASAGGNKPRTSSGGWGSVGSTDTVELRPVGWVESSLVNREAAPKQGDEGSPEAWLVFDPVLIDGLSDLRPGTDIIVLTWLDLGRRDVLRTRPRGLPNPERGVFSTRSPDRPNPIGLHRVHITAIDGTKIRVRNLEALDGTPIVDVKPILDRRLEM